MTPHTWTPITPPKTTDRWRLINSSIYVFVKCSARFGKKLPQRMRNGSILKKNWRFIFAFDSTNVQSAKRTAIMSHALQQSLVIYTVESASIYNLEIFL